MDLAGHQITGDVLAPGRVARDDDRLQVGKGVLPAQLAEDLVGEVKGGQPLVVDRNATGAPAIAIATPAHFVLIELVAAAAPVARGEARGDHDGIFERSTQKGGGDGRAEIVMGIASRAVDQDERTGDVLIPAIERIGAIQQRPRRAAAEREPFGAVGCRGCAGRS